MTTDCPNNVYLFISLNTNGLLPIVFDKKKQIHPMSFHCNMNSSPQYIVQNIDLEDAIHIKKTFIYTFNCDNLAAGHLAVQLYQIAYIFKEMSNTIHLLQLETDDVFYNSMFDLMNSLDFHSFKLKPNTLYFFDSLLMSTKVTGCSDASINYINTLIDNKDLDYIQKDKYYTVKFHNKFNYTNNRSFLLDSIFWKQLEYTHDNIQNCNELCKAKSIRGCSNIVVSWGTCAVINVILHAFYKNILVNVLIHEGYMTEYYQMISLCTKDIIVIHENDTYCDCFFYGNKTRMFKNVDTNTSNIDISLLI